MRTLLDKELNFLDKELYRYRTINRDIWARRAEVMAKNGEDLVGSRSGGISKPTESTVIKLSTDVPLRNLELFKETVESFKNCLTDEQQEIFDLRWGQASLDWEEIAERLFTSSSTIYRKRRTILETYAMTKGML